jgi:MFS family permease
MTALSSHLQKISPWQNFNEFFISLVYFVQGSGGITAIAGSLILREQFGLDFYQIGLIGAASVIPWSIKPLYGLLTDLLPIGGYRRRPYLHFGPLLAAVGFGVIAFYAHDFTSFLVPLVVANIGLGLTDVAVDGFIVEQSTPQNVARLQGLTQASIRIAAFITSFFSGLLIYREILTASEMYALQALLPLVTFGFSFFIQEKRVTGKLEHAARDELSLPFIGTMLVIFVAIVGNLIYGAEIASFLRLPGEAVSVLIWGGFFVWMVAYFLKLKKLKMTNYRLQAGSVRKAPIGGSPPTSQDLADCRPFAYHADLVAGCTL